MTAPRTAVARVAALPFEVLEGCEARATVAGLTAWLAPERGLDAERDALSAELHRLAGPAGDADTEGARRRHALLRIRRAVFHGAADAHAPDGSLPAPLADRITAHLAGVAEHRAGEERLASSFAEEVAAAERAILAAMTAPLTAEALRLVSRSLLGKVVRAAAGTARRGHERSHAVAKALAYLARFVTKTSPNGVFCATTRTTFDGDRAVVRGGNRAARVEVRLAVGEARKVAACLAADPALESAVIPRANPTLRRTATGWTCWRPASPRDPDDTEVRVEVPEHPVLAAFLGEAEAGTRNVPDLVEAAATRCGLDPESPEVRAFYRKLVDRGLLVAEIAIPWSEPRPLAALARSVRAAGLGPAWLPEIEAVEQAIDALPALDPAARAAALDPIATRLAALPHVRPLVEDELFRTDTAGAIEVTLPSAVAGEVERFAERYARLYGALYPARLFRARSVRKFLARWPADTDVPLLDLYHGVFDPASRAAVPAGFPEPPRTAEAPEWEEARRAFREAREWFARRARETPSGAEIVLGDAEWDALPAAAAPAPFSAGVLFQIDAAGPAAIEAGRWRACVNAVYPGGGLAVARLASLHAPRSTGEPAWIEDELRRGHRWLAREDAVLAEVSFLHSGRTANAGLRPPLLAHEIVLPGDVATPGAIALPLADLVVRFDPASGEFVLRSRSQGVRVLPVVTSGISTEGLLDFLVEIGRQGTQPLAWFPGFDAEGVTHWPRVVSGRVVLFRERWCFGAREVPGAGARRIDFAAFAAVARWRERHELPRRVFVHTSDQPKPFFVDLESPLLVEAMLRSIAPRGAEGAAPVLHVGEMLPGPDGLWLRDAHGRYASEFLLHVARPASRAAAAEDAPAHETALAPEPAR